MIVVIAGERADPLNALLGENLAILRRREGCSVLLVDAAREQACRAWAAARSAARLHPRPALLALDGAGFGQRLERVLGSYDDVLIDAGDCASQACRAALVAFQVALVPIAARDADPARHYGLIARLNAARMFNPGLRVLFVAADAGAEDLRAVRAYAAEVMAGHVAATVLDRAALAAGAAEPGRCACDGADAAARGVAALGHEVFGHCHRRRRA